MKKGTKPNIPSKIISPRGLARSVARHRLEKKGALHNAIKSGHFANNWRVYANAKEVK